MEEPQFEQLIKALKVASNPFTVWLNQHDLTADSSLEQINALLVKSARGFETQPTIYDYLAGGIALLTPDEAFALFEVRDLSKDQFSVLQAKLPAVIVGPFYRYEALAAQAALQHMLNFFTINIVKSIVDSPAAFQALRQNGLNPISPPNKVFSRHNVCKAIAQARILPPWIAPDHWVTARLKTIRSPLLLLQEITRLYNVTTKEVEWWKASHQIWYMSHQGVTRFLSSSIPK